MYPSPIVLIFSTPSARARRVEGREERVQRGHQGGHRQAAGDLGEPDEVAEDDGDIVVAIRDQLLPGVEAVDDRLRQHVE